MQRVELFDRLRPLKADRSFSVADVSLIDALADDLGISRIAAPAARVPSKRCEDFIKGYEKCVLKAYLPTPNDVPTIGWGSTGADIQLGMSWTQAQADERFGTDLARFARNVDALLGAAPTTQAQFDALVSFAYNVGYGEDGLKGSTLLRMHRDADYDGAAGQFARWNKQKGKVLDGLTKRRAAEARMYKGLPA